VSKANETGVIILAKSTMNRAAWESLLTNQPGLTVIGGAADIEEIQPTKNLAQKTAVLVDTPNLSLEWLKKLAEVVGGQNILCLGDEFTLQQIVALLQAGIGGCLLRESSVPDLVRSLTAVSRGEIVLPPSLAAQALTALARGSLPQQITPESLTDREQDVLSLLAQGRTNKEIAQTLFLSVRTIEAHLHNIYGKLNVSSRTEAVLWAVQREEI
jgi:DNA-binding NarL/FixJ family response regulator